MEALLVNDRLSHWFISAVLTWLLIFVIFGFLVFHLWLKIPTIKVASFSLVCCGVQFAVTPWLFSARGTVQNPKGNIARRAAALIVLFCAFNLLFFYYLRISWPDDPSTHQFTNIAIIGTALLGILGLTLIAFTSRRTS